MTTVAPAVVPPPFTGGELVFAGGTDWSQADAEREAKYPNLPDPHRIKSLIGIKIMFIAGGPSAVHAMAGDSEGRLFTWGRNDKGQLGHGDLLQRNVPTIVEGLKGKFITTAAGGKGHTVVVTQDGESYSWGTNIMGQLGVGAAKSKGKVEELMTSPVKALVVKASTVSCGTDFTVWLCSGTVFSAGSGQYGQLGDGSDHSYNAKDSSIQMMTEPSPTPRSIATLAERTITRVTCGQNHSIAVDSEGGVYTWGNGGYGRLGHKVQQEEHKPRRIEFFAGRYTAPSSSIITASQTASFAIGPGTQLYSWGKTKANGDNQMYPNAVADLSGWNIRSMACGPAVFAVAADNSVITWGSATNGELAYGSSGKKSSANPDKVSALEGIITQQVAVGLGFSMFLLDDSNPSVAKLPVFESSVPKEAAAPEAEEKDTKAKGKRKAPEPAPKKAKK
ncbi:MAG: hypothetical protein WDW38_007738 [Sanguina aurantia]